MMATTEATKSPEKLTTPVKSQAKAVELNNSNDDNSTQLDFLEESQKNLEVF